MFLLLYRREVPQARSLLNDQLLSVQTTGSPAGIGTYQQFLMVPSGQICMRVVFGQALKKSSAAIGLLFLNFSFKFLKNESNLLLVRITVCMGTQTVILFAEPCSNIAGKSTIVLWITARIEYLRNSNIPQSKPKQCIFNKFAYFNEFSAYFKNPNSTDWFAVSNKCQLASKRNNLFKDAM